MSNVLNISAKKLAANLAASARMKSAWAVAKAQGLSRLTKECFTKNNNRMELKLEDVFTEKELQSVNLILNGGKFNGTVYGQKQGNFRISLGVYVNGQYIALGICVMKEDAEQAKADFLAKLGKFQTKTSQPQESYKGMTWKQEEHARSEKWIFGASTDEAEY